MFYITLLLFILYRLLPRYLSALLPLLASRRFDYLLTLGASVLPATVVCVSFVTVISWEILLLAVFKDIADEAACSLICSYAVPFYKTKMIYYFLYYTIFFPPR